MTDITNTPPFSIYFWIISRTHMTKNIIIYITFFWASITPLPTIILINGIPHFVILNDDFYISQVIQSVPDYFESELSHEQIVTSLISSPSFQEKTSDLLSDFFTASDVTLLKNVEFVQFFPNRAILDRIAVDRVRNIAQRYSYGEMKIIYLKISHQGSNASRVLAQNRLFSVKDLLISFGVDQYAIVTEMANTDRAGENSFLRVDYGR